MSNSVIKVVEPYSPLFGKVNIGDRLVSLNGNSIKDVLDYMYYSYDPNVTAVFARQDGTEYTVQVKKHAGMELGLEFEDYLMDCAMECTNNCVFCFVDQMPPGMRKSLYFKDDDARMSFLTGSYITLTNLTDRELQRICDLKISPINVSVHTTNPDLRVEMMGNYAAAEIMDRIKKLSEAGITMNCQVVCCPGYNDGKELLNTIHDLAAFYPAVNSVAVVPVGLTKYRNGLEPLKPFNKEKAGAAIDVVEAFAAQCQAHYGSKIVFCSDEFYILAERELPDDEYYEEYSQLDNGVGMLRLLKVEFETALKMVESDEGDSVPFTVVTGEAAAPYLEKLLMTAAEKCDKIKGQVCAIRNDFFGHQINVAGLVTGGDLIAQLKGKALGEKLLIPSNMLRHGETVFLDDVTVADVERELNVKVIDIPQDGAELLYAMLGEEL